MTRRFFVENGVAGGDTVAIDGALAHRLARVLRLRAGSEIVLFDGSGIDARVLLDTVGDRTISGSVLGRAPGPAEARVRVHLYQSITKGERFEWLIEKATEIGVARIVPLIAARAVVKTAGDGNRADRWRRIAVEAAEQCERSTVPVIDAPTTFESALATAPGILVVPYEEAHESAPNIHAVLAQRIDELFALGEVSLLIGPEGGYEPGEIARAEAVNAAIVTLGERVLRSETAGLVGATLVLHAAGELG